MNRAALLALCLFQVFWGTGCASVWQQILPPGFEPVTRERCEALDMRAIGEADGKNAQRAGDKFDYWKKDCRNVGVNLDRALYDEGYARGLEQYCSCEEGFISGAKEEFEELRGQFQSCGKAMYKEFVRGRDLGKKEVSTIEEKVREATVKKIPPEELRARGVAACSAGGST